MIFEEALQINYHHQDYHQLERGGFDAKCREHDLVHKEKHQDAGGNGGGDDGDDDDGDDGDDAGGNCDGDDHGCVYNIHFWPQNSILAPTKPKLQLRGSIGQGTWGALLIVS